MRRVLDIRNTIGTAQQLRTWVLKIFGVKTIT